MDHTEEVAQLLHWFQLHARLVDARGRLLEGRTLRSNGENREGVEGPAITRRQIETSVSGTYLSSSLDVL